MITYRVTMSACLVLYKELLNLAVLPEKYLFFVRSGVFGVHSFFEPLNYYAKQDHEHYCDNKSAGVICHNIFCIRDGCNIPDADCICLG